MQCELSAERGIDVSKLTDIIRREIDARAGGVQLTPAEVIAVQADFKRADVKLIENGAVIKGILNQSGNKLTVGQSVKIAYQTLPSAGWIAFTNGETDPIGGGGGGVQVESAAIITTAEDFIVTQETMIDYSPATKVLYGAAPAFIICQENYMLMAANWTNTQKASVIANEQYFPDATHITCYYVTSGRVRREEQYIYSFIRQRSWSTYKGEQLRREVRKIIYEYPTNDPTETPTFVLDTVQKLLPTATDYATVMDVGNNTARLSNYLTDMFMVPRAARINHKSTANALLQPFFPEGVDYYCALYIDTAYENNGWGWVGQNDMTSVVYPFKNRAEQDFSMGVTQRVEPVED